MESESESKLSKLSNEELIKLVRNTLVQGSKFTPFHRSNPSPLEAFDLLLNRLQQLYELEL